MSNRQLARPTPPARGVVIILLSVAVLSILLLTRCVRQNVVMPPAHRLPEPQQIVLPVPDTVRALAGAVTEAAMQNVLFHVDDDIRFNIHYLRGRMVDLSGDDLLILDDKNRIELQLRYAEMGLTADALTLLLNRYVFGYRGSPLKDLVVRLANGRIIQTGTMHKIIDIPFEMTAELSATPEGMIRIHPVRMEISGLDGVKLLAAVGRKLENLLDLSGARGVRVEGNDLLLDPLASLPPPRTSGRLTAVRIEGDEVIQVFGARDAAGAEPLKLPTAARNYIYFQGGTIRFGKLHMVLSEMLTIDADESDPFDFYLDYYHTQLVAGYHVTAPDLGLITYMPDFDDVGTPAGKVQPRPIAGGGAPRPVSAGR